MRRIIKNLFNRAGYQLLRRQFLTDADYIRNKAQFNPDKKIVVFDVGANVGNYAAKIISFAPSAVLYCFEPFQDSFAQLSARFADNASVTTAQLALSNQEGKRRFYINQHSSETNSLLKPANELQDSFVDVACSTIDAFAQKLGLEYIDVLKIDVQGTELDVLMGAAAMLETQRIRLIRVEVIFDQLYEGQSFFGDTLHYLTARGYKFSGFIEPVYNNNHMLWADEIFVK